MCGQMQCKSIRFPKNVILDTVPLMHRSRDGVKAEQGSNINGESVPDPLYLRRYEHFPEYYR